MGAIFSPPKAPKVTPKEDTTPPGPDDSEVEEERRRAAQEAKARKGRASRILTGQQAKLGDAPVRRTTLLGQRGEGTPT